MSPQEPVTGRVVGLAAFAAASIGLLSIPLAAAAGGPYLSSDRVNCWIVVFAIALLTLLVAIPFALEYHLRERQDDRDKRWERAVLSWGGLAAAVLALAVLLGSGSGFSGSSLAGTLGLIALLESGLVVLAVGAWLLSN
ncbi:hypothetical protein BH10ACT11_BH10ACT11_11490 [soil metagenome]